MNNDNLRICRMYCDLSAEEVAKLASIPFERYLRFENGEDVPTEDEMIRLSAVYNIEKTEIEDGIEKTDKFNIHQELESYLFPTPEVTNFSKVQITDLAPVEKRIILTLRQCKNQASVMEKIFNIILEDIE